MSNLFLLSDVSTQYEKNFNATFQLNHIDQILLHYFDSVLLRRSLNVVLNEKIAKKNEARSKTMCAHRDFLRHVLFERTLSKCY